MIGLKDDLKNELDVQRMCTLVHLGHGPGRLLGALAYRPYFVSPTTHISEVVDPASAGGIACVNTGRLRRK